MEMDMINLYRQALDGICMWALATGKTFDDDVCEDDQRGCDYPTLIALIKLLLFGSRLMMLFVFIDVTKITDWPKRSNARDDYYGLDPRAKWVNDIL